MHKCLLLRWHAGNCANITPSAILLKIETFYSNSLFTFGEPSLIPRLLLAGGGKGGSARSEPAPEAAIAAAFAAAAAKADGPACTRVSSPVSKCQDQSSTCLAAA